MCKYCEHAEEFWDTGINNIQFLLRFPKWKDEASEDGFNHLFKIIEINDDNGEVYTQWYTYDDGLEWKATKCPHCQRELN